MTALIVERSGISSSFQDMGRLNLQYLGIVQGGCIDQENFLLGNAILHNDHNEGQIEFAYQGPKIKVTQGACKVAITGNVLFNIIRSDGSIVNGRCYRSYYLKENDTLDVLTTVKSVYGYIGFAGGMELKSYFKSVSANSRSKIGPNNGNKIANNDTVQLKKSSTTKDEFALSRIPQKDNRNVIRVLEGPQQEYFSSAGIKAFYGDNYSVSNLTDRMGMRMQGPKISFVKSPNIKSEGIIRGSIQVPADGQPIVLLSDHQTIGGYPKIAVVAAADYDHLAQSAPGSFVRFKKINIREAVISYQLRMKTIDNMISSIVKIN